MGTLCCMTCGQQAAAPATLLLPPPPSLPPSPPSLWLTPPCASLNKSFCGLSNTCPSDPPNPCVLHPTVRLSPCGSLIFHEQSCPPITRSCFDDAFCVWPTMWSLCSTPYAGLPIGFLHDPPCNPRLKKACQVMSWFAPPSKFSVHTHTHRAIMRKTKWCQSISVCEVVLLSCDIQVQENC